MIFHRITLTNLFSYKGEQTFNLAPTEGQSSRLALIIGRNGFGKTSLLNAVKLLFLGTEDKNQRRSMSRSAYVLGDGGKWSGILNRQARSEGATSCSVRIEVGPPDHVELVAQRSWTIKGDSFVPNDEVLEVEVDGRPLAGEVAEARLDEFLPRELVPFFFFDGEEIRYLAETSDVRRAEAMERLLSLSFVNGVENELSGLARDWRREVLPAEIQAQIASEEAKLTAITTAVEASRVKAADFKEQKHDAEEQADKVQHKMDQLRRGGGLADSASLEAEVTASEIRLQQMQNSLAYDIATDAPLIANPSLVAASIGPLAELVDKKARSADSVIETLFKVLPERLFNEPPQPRDKLSGEQQKFYETKLRKILDGFGISDDGSTGLLGDLDLTRARHLLDQLRGVNSSMKLVREHRARRLREISGLKAKLDDLKADRREAEFGSSDAAARYAEYETEYADLQQQIGRFSGEIEKGYEHAHTKLAEEAEVKRLIKSLEKQVHDATKADNRLRIAVALRESFKEYRQVRREAKREEIEAALNRRFNTLMSGHSLISVIKVDEDFYLSFHDKKGDPVGSGSISHGMRQLAVTALLWALKDVSGRPLPIIVDTPLARIDRENQENLLIHYYPNAAEQVIVLATDSEIDERKYDLVQPQVDRIFVLSNPDGETTSALEIKRGAKHAPAWKAVMNG